jgi:hypothetical protein
VSNQGSGERRLAFRDYTFHAGRLARKRVADISDRQLEWALQYNTEYLATYTDPRSVVKYQGSVCTVAHLPPGVAERRARYAAEALRACNAERDYRREQDQTDLAADGEHTQATPAAFDPDEPSPRQLPPAMRAAEPAPAQPGAGNRYQRRAKLGELRGLLARATLLLEELDHDNHHQDGAE